jgi:hypothetical protein
METSHNQSDERILAVLERRRIPPTNVVIQSNLYEFPYRGLKIRFMNDNPMRTSFGTIFKPQEDMDSLEKVMALKNLTFYSEEEGDEAQRLMDYRHFIFKGRLEQRINNIIVLADLPIGYVMRIQDKRRTVCLESTDLYPRYLRERIKSFFKR